MQSSSDIFHRVVNLRRIIAFLGKNDNGWRMGITLT